MAPSDSDRLDHGSTAPLRRALVHLIQRSVQLLPDDIGAAVQQAGRHLGASDTEVALVDLAQQELRMLRPRLHGGGRPVDGPGAGEAFRGEVPVWEVEADQLKLWVPILDSAERVGVLGATLPRRDPDVVPSWALLASLVGELVVTKDRYGDAVTVARRAHAVSLAAELRWLMLPPLTFTSPDVLISGILAPPYTVAGDTFDYSVGRQGVDVALFDAMGHGLEASRMANMAVAAYRNSRRRDVGLPEMLQHMDEAIEQGFGDSRFVTAQLVQLDTGSGWLRSVNAGHPPGVVLRGDGTFEELPGATTVPLGLGARATQVHRSRLLPGDIVLLHTDGVEDARSRDGERFGVDRLRRRVAALLTAGTRPAEVLRLVVEDLHAHERPLRDDATLLMLGWRLGDRAVPPSMRGTSGP